ncbi:MAG: aminomethyl-transferring glycine dehydrogenase [Candidatus Marinimicrobia bacterium]|jgi:glycine dehydrogenase|nr:aminomethyl-transferring glycine dehydrogenase [Candidatus Neomarinimicrobiota bacterium]MDP6992406.1 aminomethyl-transferring glycine dehydrogenase [Candidatus Neomarinimicrobiota bacterium]
MSPDIKQNFSRRHIGPNSTDQNQMLSDLGFNSIDALIEQTLPESIRTNSGLNIGDGLNEFTLLKTIKEVASKNKVARSYIGMGYYGTITPPVIQRNILENPGWYTAYTPYQAEISQGRLEALLNFQTMVTDMTGMNIANASLLDEATAAAEAMVLLLRASRKRNQFLVADDCHPQTLDVLKTRANPIGIELVIQSTDDFEFNENVFGALIQYPATDGKVTDFTNLCEQAHDNGVRVAMATDLLSLAILPSPGEIGADVAIGSSQRFGVPMGFGGPHAAFIAAKEEFKRKMPGRIIGVSQDSHGNRALRMALQTREQHIRRDKATSNICTAQVLLAVMAGMYAVYHGAEGIREIAKTVHQKTKNLASAILHGGHTIIHDQFFDTIRVKLYGISPGELKQNAEKHNLNFRYFDNGEVGISLDETVSPGDLVDILLVFNVKNDDRNNGFDLRINRSTEYLTHEVFSAYHTETEMMRYLHRLEAKDLTLNTSMISLGSCTMKLNAAVEMMPITWPEFAFLHPFAPSHQTEGYKQLCDSLAGWLMDITGLQGCSLQPNSGAQGEFAGLLVIRAYHLDRGDSQRNICLIPASAHGTNPASAVMCGMDVVVVKCDDSGNIDIEDLKTKAKQYSESLAAIMVTYPSTHGVFEESIGEVCDIVHQHGGQVYLDGANLNAMVGLARLGEFGTDVCHINLHKTFAIPHGGGGPGMGPICVTEHLVPYLPGHPILDNNEKAIHAVSAAPLGSAGILPISWAYIALLGDEGLKASTEAAILNANYMAHKLVDHFPILYRGANGYSAHEFILDLRPLKKESGISDEDVAKRLIDYGFHAPTMSFPVPGTLMVEPTESESKSELDRFCEAMISIKNEIMDVRNGSLDLKDNPLVNAPHTALHVTSDDWSHSYSREQAAYPADWLKAHKYWPSVGRVDNAFGDRNLVCTCPPIEDYEN